MKRFLSLLLILLVVGCVQPPGGPHVKPNPTPEVTVTLDTPLGLSQIAYDQMKHVQSDNRASETETIAKAHADQAAEGRKSPYALVADMQTNLGKEIAASMSEDARSKWKDWQAAVGSKIDDLEKAGKLDNRLDWVAAYEEIASGLRGGK